MYRLLLLILLAAVCSACNQNSGEVSDDIQESSVDWRYQKPAGVIDDEKALESIDLKIVSNYPIWRENLNVTVSSNVNNLTDSFVYARIMPHLFIYDYNTKKPLYWSNIDLSFAESIGPGQMGVLSLPVTGINTTVIAIRSIKFADVNTETWPDANVYELVPTGKYLLRLEMDVYNDKNERLGTLLSNFVEFTTIFTPPEVIVP